MRGAAIYAGHSAIQLSLGFLEEGFEAAIFGPPERLKLYERFPTLKARLHQYSDPSLLDSLADEGYFLIPTGGVVEYLTPSLVERVRIPVFGLRHLVRWEADWSLKTRLLEEAGMPMPRRFRSISEVDRLVIAKLPGAKGGRGYLVTRSPEEIKNWLKDLREQNLITREDDIFLQEYIVGTTIYAHYFQSPIMDRLELTGFDIRYESNVDGLRRLSPRNIGDLKEGFVVTGNLQVYPRERLLEEFIELGEKLVEATRRLIPPGVIGPFCLETVVTEDLKPIVFEFSGRIVAGTNVYLGGSPYLALYWGREMTVGRRMALEVRMAMEQGRLGEVLT
ncbi:MAG: formate--phosphoribosylaminoimidazolecarboxamide ligase [Nitrososphaerota archaeon]